MDLRKLKKLRLLKQSINILLKLIFLSSFVTILFLAPELSGKPQNPFDHLNESEAIPGTTPPDSLRFPIPQNNNLSNGFPTNSPLYLNDPANVTNTVVYDSVNNQYILTSKVGSLDYRTPYPMTMDEYSDLQEQISIRNYWRERSKAAGIGSRGGVIPQLKIGGEVFDRIFGSNTIDIRPQGSAELIFGIISNRRDDPSLDVSQRRTTNFDFQEKIQMSVIAKIGDKIEFKTNYNTESTFAFENKLKLRYEGKEDEILQLLEAGDVNLPLNGTLIQGSQSLFGIKTKLKFGRTTITGVFSEQKSESRNISVQGGAQTSTFNFKADQYEDNKHFFIGHHFRNEYNRALSTLPIVSSNINITKIEVWVTNIGAPTTNNRNIVAFTDLGEVKPNSGALTGNPAYSMPSNESNNLTKLIDTGQVRNINSVSSYLQSSLGFFGGQDFEKVESARKLNPSEFTYNSKLGFISINTTLNSDQVLAVAYQYNIIGQDSVIYQVGEFSDQGINDPKALIVKLLKSTTLNTRGPLWKLMMKNVYSLGAYQVNAQDFRLNILYAGDENGVPTGYFNDGPRKGIPLIRLFHLDTLDSQMNPNPDGVFDFLDQAATQGGLIQATNGRIYFPLVEPFGKDLRVILGDDQFANKYCFDSLYTLTKTEAQQYPDKDKYYLEGVYKSAAGSEINLGGFNIPQGSVKVSAGGILLTENVDYTVDYTLGRVRIINQGILNSGAPVNISMESNSMFNIMTKRMMGFHANYEVNKNFNIGATLINLHQSPLTQKVNYGDEPISNTIWGIDLAYQTESRWLTKMLDKLPFYATKVPSRIDVYGEFAHFIPGHSSAIGDAGTTYIDDFEGSKSGIDLKTQGAWSFASTPQGQTEFGMFPEASIGTKLKYGYNRALLAWYIIDPLFYRNEYTPSNIDKNDQSLPYVREVLETEVFPNKELPNGQPSNLPTFNLAFYPDERGSYNYDVSGEPGFSAGLKPDGKLKNPETRWGGVQRKIESSDFDATNIEYLEFWVMDPFIGKDGQNGNPLSSGGKFYINLGDISEDILRDGRKSFENGLPTTATVANVDTTEWGRVPKLQSLVFAFDNNVSSRQYQDVGYDGLSTNDERSFFDTTYIKRIALDPTLGASSVAYQKAENDPSADNYHYFRGPDYDDNNVKIAERYKYFNNPEGNSPASEQVSGVSYQTQSTPLPNTEDINKDNTLSEAENYYQYVIDLKPQKMIVGQNYITDIHEAVGVKLQNGGTTNVKWYQFKVPIRTPDKVVGKIQNFQSIRFMRMFLKGFEENITLRFATLELVRGEWRKYNSDLLMPGDYVPGNPAGQTSFDVSAVNIEENGKRTPVPYVIPSGIEREVNQASTNLQKLNEQSLSLRLINLADGDARAIYKTTDFDFRQFKYLKLYAHAEKVNANDNPKAGELHLFIRVGSDFKQNFYEYDIPLSYTDWYTSALNPDAIWPEANNVNIDLEKLVSIKEHRNEKMRGGNANISLNTPYYEYIGNAKVTVMGSPSISSVKTILIGVRNPKKQLVSDDDDMMPKSAEVWINELRLTDFNDKTGWAATARVRAQLADLGDVQLSGTYSTAGFGSVEKKINETQKENITSFDVATNLELGKFLPEKLGIRIPLHYDYSSQVSNPEYNPMDPDVKLANDLNSYKTDRQKDSVLNVVQDVVTRKNINLINVRKDRTGVSDKNKVYDIENFNVSYSYSEIYKRNIDIEYDSKKTYRGGFGYNFSNQPKNYKPLSKIKFLNKRYLALIKDFNFHLTPKLLSFRTEMLREFNESKLRNKSQGLIIIEPTYYKKFEWQRIYSLRYDPATSVQLEYDANANAAIDEPQGRIDTREKRDSVWTNILNMGRMQLFTQTFAANYTIPINKIPIFDWLSSSARYSSEYRWTGSPVTLKRLGNTIENSNNKQLNGSLNLTTLYNKVPFLKKINQVQSSGSSKDRERGAGNDRGRTQVKKSVLKADEGLDAKQDSVKKIDYFKEIYSGLFRFIMGFKTAQITFTEGNGTVLPGFFPEPDVIGNNFTQNAPGLGFVFGSQEDIREKAARNGWLSKDTLLNTPYATKYTTTINFRTTFEPFRDFKIDFTANRNYTENHNEYYKANANGEFKAYSPTTTGSFSMTYMTIATAFVGDNEDNSNKVFQTFLDNRIVVAQRLANGNPNFTNNPEYELDTVSGLKYPKGYGPTSQQVLIPAFLAAYSGRNAGSIGLNPFPKIPIPNWQITYNGLTKIKSIQKIFRTVTISNAYRSTYSVGSYATNINYKTDENGYQIVKNLIGNYIPEKQIDQVMITEQFSPLIKIDLGWQNSLLTNFEIKKSRTLSLSFVNNQMTEVISNELIIGIGYRFKDVSFNIVSGRSNKKIKSDLNLKCDFSIRSNKTILRRVDQNVNQISAGQNVISLNTSADYQVSDRFTLRAFFDKVINNPYISNSFPNSTTNAGISVRFSLAP